MEQCLPVFCSHWLWGYAEGSCCSVYDTSPKTMRGWCLCWLGEPDWFFFVRISFIILLSLLIILYQFWFYGWFRVIVLYLVIVDEDWFFTSDSGVCIPLCLMGMTTAFCLNWKKGFCKGLIVLGTTMFWQIFSLPSIVQHVPWLAPLLREVNFFVNDPRTFRSFVMKQSQKRAAQLIVNRKDLFSYLVNFICFPTSLIRHWWTD